MERGNEKMNLKELFGDEIAAKIEAVLGEKGLTAIFDSKESPEYIQKSKLDEVVMQRDQLNGQLGELNGQFETLKKSAKGNEELTNTINELQTKNTEWEGKYKNTLLESAIKMSAVKSKAKDPSDVLAFIDRSKLEIGEDGSIKGLDEQIGTLVQSKAYLFGEVIPAGSGANPASAGAQGKVDYRTASKEEYASAMKELGVTVR